MHLLDVKYILEILEEKWDAYGLSKLRPRGLFPNFLASKTGMISPGIHQSTITKICTYEDHSLAALKRQSSFKSLSHCLFRNLIRSSALQDFCLNNVTWVLHLQRVKTFGWSTDIISWIVLYRELNSTLFFVLPPISLL